MRKILCLLFLSIFITLTSCGEKEEKDLGLEKEVSIIVPNGIPYLAIGGLLEYEKVNIESVSGPSNLQAALVSGSHDIVIAPINLGANLYNKGNSKYKVSHILSSNNAYIVTKKGNKLDSISDLKDEKVLAFAEAGIPANVLKTVYKNNNLDISDIDFKYSSSAEVYSVFSNETTIAKYALMSEPEISKLVVKDNVEIKTLDLSVVLGEDVAQACVFVNKDKINDKDVNKVLEFIGENVLKLNTDVYHYVDSIINLDRTFEATGRDVLCRALPLCNIVFKEAKINKNDIESILNILGVATPDDKFYK